MTEFGKHLASAIRLLNEAENPDTEWEQAVEILSDAKAEVEQAETAAIEEHQKDLEA